MLTIAKKNYLNEIITLIYKILVNFNFPPRKIKMSSFFAFTPPALTVQLPN